MNDNNGDNNRIRSELGQSVRELSNDLKLSTLGISRKSQNFMELLPIVLLLKWKFCQYQQKFPEKRKLEFVSNIL